VGLLLPEEVSSLRAPLKLLSTLAIQGALPEVVGRHQAASGNAAEIVFAPTNGVLARIAAGETADVAIITRAALDDLAAKGVVLADSIADIAVSRVGIAVKAGAAKPDIATVDALKTALLAARSVAYSQIGASGVFFAELIRRLGIADAVNAKAIVTPGGFTGEAVARGQAELAVQQVSELMAVPGLDIVGPLPAGADSVTMFSAGVLARSGQAQAALQLIAYLRAKEAAQALAKAGLQPAG
jgi:molybdate transport system substrate-binding protein